LIDDNLVEELSVFPSLSDFLTLVLDFLDVVGGLSSTVFTGVSSVEHSDFLTTVFTGVS
jgi:hypothetical protein